MDWLDRALTQMNEQMPAITQAAETAAQAVMAGKNLSVRGDEGLAFELAQRTGGFIFVRAHTPRTQRGGHVVLFALGIVTGQPRHAKALIKSQLIDNNLKTHRNV